MKTVHDVFLRAYAIPDSPNKKHKKRKQSQTKPEKWPRFALIFDTETRTTPDQSLTFGVYRICELVRDQYEVLTDGIFYADDLSAVELRVLKVYQQTAIPDVPSFPPDFPWLSRSEFMQKVFWPVIKRDGALVCGFNLPFDLSRLALAWSKGKKDVIANEEIKKRILEIGINKCARESGFDRKNFIRKLIRGVPVKRNSCNDFMRWLNNRPDPEAC
jgi:hypothetical protein